MPAVFQTVAKKTILIWIALILLSMLMHWRVFKLDLVGIHVWRQTQTQTVITNFFREDNNILNPKYNNNAHTDRIVRMEFPVMQWLFAQACRIAGPPETVSRVLSFLLGLLTVLGMFRVFLLLFNHKGLAMAGAWLFNFSPVFYYYTLNPLPDNFALCAATWSIFFWLQYARLEKIRWLWAGAWALSLATLAKLPFIVYGALPAGLALQWVWQKKPDGLKKMALMMAIYLTAILPALCWYAWVIPTWTGNGVVSGVLDNRISWAAVADILLHHLVSTLPELLVNYASFPLFVAGLFFVFKIRLWKKHPLFFPFLCLLAAVLAYFFFELNMIAKVHDYYLFPFLPLLFLVVVYGIARMVSAGSTWQQVVVGAAVLVAPLAAALRINTRWNSDSPGFPVEYLANKEKLRALLPKDARVIAGPDPSHFILLYYLDRKGWTMDEYFTPDNMDSCMKWGASYLCTHTAADTSAWVSQYITGQVFSDGDLRVFRLADTK